jgi:hypothetical protein
MGFDEQYTVEQVHNMAEVWEVLREPGIVDWWDTFYWLKTHVTLPKKGRHTAEPFGGTCSPTDFNFRTRYATHKTGLPLAARDQVVFGDLWRPQPGDGPPRRPWPALEDTAFVRSIGGKFHFVNTGQYYAIAYSGPRLPAWSLFTAAIIDEGAVSLDGYGGPGYGGYGRSSTKVGALSAVFVPGCGPVLLAQNHNVMDANTVWGRRHSPITPVWHEGPVDPYLICSGYAQPETDFDEEKRSYRLQEDLPYAPLRIDRIVQFRDDRIIVDLTLTATGDLDLAELHHAIPYFADDRIVQGYDGGLDEAVALELPEVRLTDTRTPEPEREASRLDYPSIPVRAYDVANAEGVGAAVILDGEYELQPAAPVRYREVAAAAGSLNLPLPARMEPGQTHALRYVIYAHRRPVTAGDLRRIAAEEGI